MEEIVDNTIDSNGDKVYICNCIVHLTVGTGGCLIECVISHLSEEQREKNIRDVISHVYCTQLELSNAPF